MTAHRGLRIALAMRLLWRELVRQFWPFLFNDRAHFV
jgi:hypothetical protein